MPVMSCGVLPFCINAVRKTSGSLTPFAEALFSPAKDAGSKTDDNAITIILFISALPE
jgi:hypothetical protein